MRTWVRLGALSLLVVAAAAQAQAMRPGEVVDAYRKAIRQGQSEQALSYLASDVVIYEQGFSEFDRSEYAGDHLRADLAFEKSVRRSITWRQVFEDQGYAFVMSEYRIKGRFQDTEVNLASTETMVLRRDGDAWKIAHIHLSSHNVEP